MARIIYDLCGNKGAWSDPYKRAGYDVRIITLPEHDVRLFHAEEEFVHGILAAPPCNHLASSGARWWTEKGETALLEALSIADACLRFVALLRPAWWALENPVGRLRRFYNEPTLIFDPCDYGDPYTKKTLLWGTFKIPIKNPVEAIEGSKMHRMSSSWKEQRAITPPGFAQAFFEANQ